MRGCPGQPVMAPRLASPRCATLRVARRGRNPDSLPCGRDAARRVGSFRPEGRKLHLSGGDSLPLAVLACG